MEASDGDSGNDEDPLEEHEHGDVRVCGQGMVTAAKRGNQPGKDEGYLECVECGYELPLDYARSVVKLVAEKAIAKIQGQESGDKRSYEGLIEGIEEGMGVLHPCHQTMRTMVEHLLYAAHARKDALMEVYAAQTLVNDIHAYLQHPLLHLHVALLHHISGHALLEHSSTPRDTPTPSVPWKEAVAGRPLRMGLPSVFVSRLQNEEGSWNHIGLEYLGMSARHLDLLLGPNHWLSLSALHCWEQAFHLLPTATACSCPHNIVGLYFDE